METTITPASERKASQLLGFHLHFPFNLLRNKTQKNHAMMLKKESVAPTTPGINPDTGGDMKLKMNLGKLCIIALAATLAFAAMGCTGDQQNDTKAEEPAAAEADAAANDGVEEEAVEEETVDVAALEAQVTGPWRVTSFMIDGQGGSESTLNDIKDQGSLYYGVFNADGTFSMMIHDLGRDKNPWNGTWAIDEEGLLTMTMDNGVFFTTDNIGDRMTLQVPSYVQGQNGDWKLALQKLSAEQLESEIAAANEISPLLYVGDTVDTDEYSFTIASANVVSEFYPPDTSGYYQYYEASSGSSLYLVRGTFKYLGSSYADLKYGTEAVFSLNDGEYEITGEVLGARSDSDDFYDYQVGPFESVELYIYCEMSDELISNISSAELIWKFADPLNTYYTDSSDGPRYAIVLQ